MALTPSWPGPTGIATTTDGRKALAGLIVKSATGVPRAGVFPRHTNPLVTARADMNVDIGIFEAAAVQFGGPILLTNDAVAQLPAPLASPGAGITNYYVIYAKQNESASPGTDANNNRVFGAQLSTTSFAVARAALPPGALELGTAEIPTGKTATNQGGVILTPTHQFTATEGGVVLLRNATELAAWAPHDGSPAFRLDTGENLTRVGGAWRPAVGVATYSYLSNGLPDTGAPYTSGSLTAVTAETTDASFVTAVSGLAFTLKAGVYSFLFDVNLPTATTGRSFAQAALAGRSVSRNTVGAGESEFSTAGIVNIPADGTVLTFGVFKTNGGATNVTGTLTLARIS